ncbi:hypothetical protein ACFPH6_28575 [Streptomyces xiangluensis]|uniref:Uncharacterized protein n=1 Tax=Streptomyces xiangluensis TaxID=2665720 RepID=A0ABV8YZA6_9ACTN
MLALAMFIASPDPSHGFPSDFRPPTGLYDGNAEAALSRRAKTNPTASSSSTML